MCEYDLCPRLHVDQLGPVGQATAYLGWTGLEALERRNGCRPPLPIGTPQFLAILASSASGTPGGDSFRVGVPAASQLLGVSESRVRWLCRKGHLAGAAKVGRDWSIPRSSIEARRSRAVA
jgi:Helix-turn-helix domain